jgi:transcriptional regulator with XRE-family HTH domain
MTQEELARQVNLTRSAIAYLETGSRKGKVETWDRIERALGIDQRVLRQPISF